MTVQFIHAADLHIDSPLRGLQRYEGAPADRLQGATRTALVRIVDLAIRKQVAFVIIAGDLFDGHWQDMQTGLWTASQFRRLQQANIDVYLMRGNHDAESLIGRTMRWPPNVHEFTTSKPQTFRHEASGMALHGQGFAHRSVQEDLAANYPAPLDGWFNIGVLHTSLTGDPLHDPYAPTSVRVLNERGYHYWALGHIHARRTIQEAPYIGYPGNTQGRHINEPGSKGCSLVTVTDGHLDSITFEATDSLRWATVEVELEEQDGDDRFLEKLRDHLLSARDRCEDCFCAARIVVTGACRLHEQLALTEDGRQTEQLSADIRNLANEFEESIWVEKVVWNTRPVADINRLRQQQDLLGDLLRMSAAIANDDHQLRQMGVEFQPLIQKERAVAALSAVGIDLQDPQQWQRWLRQAEQLLVTQMLEMDL